MLYNEIITANKNITEQEKALNNACIALSRAINEKKDIATITDLEKAVDVASIAFVKGLKRAYYADKVASESPMLSALMDYTVPSVKVKKEENDFGVRVFFEFVHEIVNVKEFEQYATTEKSFNVMHKAGWKICAEQVNDLYRAYRAQEHETNDKPEKAVSVNALRDGLQRMYDCIVFVDNGKGENKYLAKKSDAHAVYNRTTVYDKKAVNQYKKTTYDGFIKAVTCALICNVNGLAYEEINKQETSANKAKPAKVEKVETTAK